MKKISEIQNEYRRKIDHFDLEILIAKSLKKTREFIIAHSNQTLTKKQLNILEKNIQRRILNEPIAYIFGEKGFYGLDFKVNKHTLIPRPETEMMIDDVIKILRNTMSHNTVIVDVGTGSGCIIISIAKLLEKNIKYYATDISKEALKVAKKNSQIHKVAKKIKFFYGNLLDPILNKKIKLKTTNLIITANLPYLSKKIFESAPKDVKNFEPKSALYSTKNGLAHYEELLKQLSIFFQREKNVNAICLLEISPEQKNILHNKIKSIFPKAKISFQKDLAKKWRLCKIIF